MTEQKLAFLKREEIKTMAKDLARLQEETAAREKQKISELRIEARLKKETQAREKIAQTIIPKQEGKGEAKPEKPSLPPAFLRPSPLEKIIIRIGLILFFLVFLLALGFGYWFFKIRGRGGPKVSPSPSPLVSPTASVLPESPSPLLEKPEPASLIPVQESRLLIITPLADLKTLVQETIKTGRPQGDWPEFVHLVVQQDSRFLSFKELLAELNFKVPDDFFDKVESSPNNFTFFLFAKTNESRLGFIAKTKDGAAAGSMIKAWEETMEKDSELLFSLLGKKGPAPSKAFREVKYKNIPFRYLSFAEKNLGTSWAILENYLVITSSGESLIRTIDRILEQP